MKSTLALLAAAASVEHATATLFGNVGAGVGINLGLGFTGAKPFTCPGNSDNKCNDKQKGGWDWSDLNVGDVTAYGGFNFNGWTCEDSFLKRGELQGRHFGGGGGGKVITGSCGHETTSAPSITCDDSDGIDVFSIDSFDVSVEFDARMEFHYEMPSGDICKTSQDCYKSGTTVTNNQCGGAKKVTFVYPKQPKQPKDTCKIGIHKINWDCDKNKPQPSTSIGVSTASSSTQPGQTDTYTAPGYTLPGQQTTPGYTLPGQQTTPGYTTASVPVTVSKPTTIVTTYQTTSTVFTTSVKTITSCAPEITNCPARSSGGTAVVTVTIPVSTTVCPVTETLTRTGPAPTGGAPGTTSKGQETTPGNQSSAKPTASKTEQGGQSSSAPSTPQPTGSLPCPSVVPQCLNTFLHLEKECESNLDAACYCPSKEFVDSIFSCLYAHGETDDIISEAVSFFQGICAPFIPQNPVIATGAATVTAIITVTGTPRVTSVDYTTIVVATTVVEPCTTQGTTIPGSSTTKVISTEVTVPQISLTAGPTAGPGTPAPTTAPGAPVQSPSASTLITAPPASATGTGGLPVPTASRPVPVTAGAGRMGAGLGLVLAVAAAVVAL
ncbi:hypothetical protein TOPH_02818 [Tolypocladium ophioglossoides CBS 100239]|uniref:CFEM domain-containing protein n=1 Tax=Tolypocladium ophioglossoides (strain CBS 100239) TaxID=1163406 RepID=A0A0L0NEY7_TOLOC|nr:hypothetical protein TOPH_02818 [Tolypocladium ophioglossoides CBS 100239]